MALLRSGMEWARNFCLTYRWAGALTISYASLVHSYEALILLATTSANETVGVSAMLVCLPEIGLLPQHIWLGLFLIMTVILSTYSMHSREVHHFPAFLMLLPQQTFLLMECLGAILDALNGHYANGYAPPVSSPAAFISADQIIRILLAPMYTWAIWDRSQWPDNGGGWR